MTNETRYEPLNTGSIKQATEAVEQGFKEGLTDEDISTQIDLSVTHVRFIRTLLGLRKIRGAASIEENYRCITGDGDYLRINAFGLKSIQEKLELANGNKYKWIATNIKPGQFTIKIEPAD